MQDLSTEECGHLNLYPWKKSPKLVRAIRENNPPYDISVSVSLFLGTKSPCAPKEEPTPKCKKTCEDGYNVTFEKDLHYGATSYAVSSEVENIQTEIMTNGPVEGTFKVYEDFLSYKSGTLNLPYS